MNFHFKIIELRKHQNFSNDVSCYKITLTKMTEYSKISMEIKFENIIDFKLHILQLCKFLTCRDGIEIFIPNQVVYLIKTNKIWWCRGDIDLLLLLIKTAYSSGESLDFPLGLWGQGIYCHYTKRSFWRLSTWLVLTFLLPLGKEIYKHLGLLKKLNSDQGHNQRGALV